MSTRRAAFVAGCAVACVGLVVSSPVRVRAAGQGQPAQERPAQAGPGGRVAPPPPITQAELAKLALDIERAESLRVVKDLQVTFQQYAQFGMWDEMAALFSESAEAIFGDETVKGRDGIAKYLVTKYGAGTMGLPADALHNQILLSPVVTLSYDGNSATARWSEVTMRGRGKEAWWEGGMEVNDYVRENGRWKIARLHYYAQFAGPYETGWFTLTPTQPIVPYHYSPSLAGRPVPEIPGDIQKPANPPSAAELDRRITAMTEADVVRNLQNIYGYYVDRKMWDDVAELFTDDGVLEIAGLGVYQGAKSIRRGLERNGPVGLQNGQVHDHLQLGVIVKVGADNVTAQARGTELGMLTPKLGEAYWSVATFSNRYVKQNGTWRIREMRIFPKMKTDYYQGWAKSVIIDPPPAKEFAPDRPTPPADVVTGSVAVPAFFVENPSTGAAVKYPEGSRTVATEPLLAPPTAPTAPPPSAFRLDDLRRRLGIAKAYDAIENMSSTLGNYMDDEMWDEWADTMSREGRRIQGGGWYIGRDNIYLAMTQGHTTPPSLTTPRKAIRPHTRTQPVIHVAPDGRSAKIRTRMWLYYASPTDAGAWNSGMYPNDAAVLEDGVWRIDVTEIDETYFSSPSYLQGWAKPTPRPTPGEGGGPAFAPGALRGNKGNTVFSQAIEFPPDIPTSLMNDFRRKGFNVNFPEIRPMWFHYRNPVSGRVPPFYCPDIKTCAGQ